MAGRGKARLGRARRGEAWQGGAGQGEARRGMARFYLMLPTCSKQNYSWKDMRGRYWCDLLAAHGKGEPRIATERYRPDKGPPNVCAACYALLAGR